MWNLLDTSVPDHGRAGVAEVWGWGFALFDYRASNAK